MRLRALVVVILVCSAAGGSQLTRRISAQRFSTLRLRVSASEPRSEQNPPTTRSVWDGVYTEEQAKRGESTYRKFCLSCHGSLLTGGETASALTGATFFSNWNGLPLDELFERIRRSMPQDQPGKLSRQQNADVLAYLLSFNKFPAGKTELPRQSEFLKEIKFETTNPKK